MKALLSVVGVRRGALAGFVVLVAVLALVAASGRMVVPIAVQFVLDDAILGGGEVGEATRTLVVVAVWGSVGIVCAGVASGALRWMVVAHLERVLADLRALVFRRVLWLTPRAQERLTPGAAVSRLTSDVDTVSQYAAGGGIQLLQNIVQMLLAVAIMSIYSWLLTLVVLVATVPFLWGMQTIRGVVRERYRDVRSTVSVVHEEIGDLVQGIEVVHAFGVSGIVRDRVSAAIAAVERALRRTRYPLHANTALGELAGSAVTVVVLVGGVLAGAVWAVPGGVASAGDVVAFLFLTTFFIRPLQFAVTSVGEAQSAVAGIRRTAEVLSLPVDHEDADAGLPLPDGALDVRARGLGFSYPDGTRALSDIDLEIPFGQFVAVMGATGSGKSTLGRLLTRRLRATEGHVAIGGVEIGALAASALARRIAVVPQASFLFDGTIRTNLRMIGGDVDDAAIARAVDDLGVGDWLASLSDGLDTRVGPGGSALSAGERQLVALVRAALVDPAVLVLDEATSSVDPRLDARVQTALHRAAVGRTTIAIAHRLSTAQYADRVIVVEDGRIVEDGDPAALLARGGRFAQFARA